MTTNLVLDDALLEEAQRIGRHQTKEDAVTAALREYVGRHRQAELLKLFGTVDYAADYDYKRERQR